MFDVSKYKLVQGKIFHLLYLYTHGIESLRMFNND